MHEVAGNVFIGQGTSVNWVLVREGDDLTLIDGGWYGDLDALERDIRSLGRRPEDVQAILLTHAHVDHVGGVSRLHERYGMPVYTGDREAAHARREFLEQATPAGLLPHMRSPRALGWAVRIVRAGGVRSIVIPDARGFASPAEGLDLPGRPIPVPCPGHTSGHTAYHLAGAGVLVTGDALVTGHPLSSINGPHLLPEVFTHTQADAMASLETLGRVDAGMLLPGHGNAWTGSMQDATATAAERATGRAAG